MKIKYYSEDDILVLELSKEAYDHAEMEDNFVIHFTKDEKPVRVEILDASSFFKKQSDALPSKIKEKFFSLST